MRSLLLAAVCLCAAIPAQAAPETPEINGGFDLGLGVLDNDFYAAAQAYVSYRSTPLDVAGQLPLRLMLTGDDGVRIRRQDWDEASDFTRLLRYLDWRPNDQIRLRLGEPTGVTLGHGAIVDHFYNATDLDHYKTSLAFKWQGPRFGVEFFNNDVVNWEIMAARASYRPLGDTQSWVRDLQVALTVAVDRAAPTGAAAGVDETNQPITLRAPLWLYGVDADIPLWRGTERQLLLYTDVVAMSHSPAFAEAPNQNTGGWHVGVQLQLPAIAPRTNLTMRLEGVYMGHGYLPGYFDNLYEVERFQAQAAQNPEQRTKLAWAAQNSGPLGVRAQVDLVADSAWRFTALLALLGQDGLSTQLWLATPEMAGLSIHAHWGQQHLQAASDMGAISRTSALAELRYRIGAALSAVLQAGTRWQALDDGYAARREVYGAARLEWRL